MNPCLITYYDIRGWQIASCSFETAANFASISGLDYVSEPTGAISGGFYTGSYDRWPYMRKIELSIRELEAGRPYVVYADVDIIFNVDADTSVFSKYTGSLSIIGREYPETSFFIAYPSALPLLYQWSSSYTNFRDTDEESLMTMYRTSGSIRNMITIIPAFPYITSTVSGIATGSIGKHFYASSGIESTLYLMKQYKSAMFG